MEKLLELFIIGAGFALGAKVVFPECPVVILYGDGASGL
jgi:thiamine pyrophosphate-dependent acetolactate synthase large subunit-like protein